MSAENLRLRVDDVHAVIEHTTLLCKKQLVFAQANCNKIGMSGHSFGAQTTLAVTGQQFLQGNQSGLVDSCITSAIAFSSNARQKTNLDNQFSQIRIPFLSITVTNFVLH